MPVVLGALTAHLWVNGPNDLDFEALEVVDEADDMADDDAGSNNQLQLQSCCLKGIFFRFLYAFVARPCVSESNGDLLA
jgi:hypothetical protein